MILSEFNKNMAIQEYEGKQLIDRRFGVGDFKPSSGGTPKQDGLTMSQYIAYLTAAMNNGEIDTTDLQDIVESTDFSDTAKDSITQQVLDKTKANSGSVDFRRPLTGGLNKTDLTKLIIGYGDDGVTENTPMIDILDDVLSQGKDYDSVYSAISQAKTDLGGGIKEPVFDTALLLKTPGKTTQAKLENYYKYYAAMYNATDEEGNLNVPVFKYSIYMADDLDTNTKKIFYQHAMDTYNNDGTEK